MMSLNTTEGGERMPPNIWLLGRATGSLLPSSASCVG